MWTSDIKDSISETWEWVSATLALDNNKYLLSSEYINKIWDLRYDSLAKFFECVSWHVFNEKHKRTVFASARHIQTAWNISSKYMSEELYEKHSELIDERFETNDQLAVQGSALSHQQFISFMHSLGEKILLDAQKDANCGRVKLAESLFQTSETLQFL